MDHSKLLGVVAIENGVWFSPFGHEIPAAENLEFVTFGFHHELVSQQYAEIERLRNEVDRLTDFIRHIAKANGKIHGDMVSVAKAEVITTHNDAIVAAADTILTSLANIHIEDGTIDAFNHAVQKCRESILALKK